MEEVLQHIGNVSHTWFDFHAECKNMRWDRLSKLLHQLQQQIDSQGSLRVLLLPEEIAAAAAGDCPVPGWQVAQ
ncbi:SAC1 phosphoinositide phosphatase, putative, partial [Eimeria tenella]